MMDYATMVQRAQMFNDQPPPDVLALQKKRMLEQRNATSIPTISPPNLDQNAMQPGEMTNYYLQRLLGLGQERI